MKVVILAGGIGTRLAEETEIKPKPMIEIGGQPLLWHIMRYYSHHGFKEFFVAVGYRGEVIKRFFLDYSSLSGNLSVDLKQGKIETENNDCEDWIVHLKNTGQDTNTGGRIKRLQSWLSDGTFMVTYGDGVCNVDLGKLLAFHRSHGRIATVTAVRPPARFGGLIFDGDLVTEFTEKPQIGEGWINGGFLVFEPAVFDYLENDQSSLESDALENLAAGGQLAAYRHVESLWHANRAPWKVWNDR